MHYLPYTKAMGSFLGCTCVFEPDNFFDKKESLDELYFMCSAESKCLEPLNILFVFDFQMLGIS